MDSASLKPYVRMLRRWWWLAVASVAIAGVSSYVGLQRTPRLYRSTVTVMVGQSLEALNPSGQSLAISQQLSYTYAQLVRREPILTAAAAELGLDQAPPPERESSQQIAGTQLLEIGVVDSSPERARALADAIAHQLSLVSPAAQELTEREAFLSEQLDELESKIVATREQMNEERAKFEAATSASAIQQHQANLDALEQQLTHYQNSYASLLANTQEATNQVTVVEPATLPTRPVSPNVIASVSLAMAIGLALAVTGAVVTESLDPRVRSPGDAVQLTELPLLGTIAPLKTSKDRGDLVTALDPLSAPAESFRLLATRISLESAGSPLSTLMIASPGPGEGKSLILGNLGVAFAEAGRQVLIVDSDLRSPEQHTLFGLENELGLADLLRSPNADVAKLVQATRIPGLSLMAAGVTASSPQRLPTSEALDGVVKALLQQAYKRVNNLLTPERLDAALTTLSQRYELVLFDSAPPSLFSDAAILGSRVDAVLLVADVTVTERALLTQVAAELRRGGSKLVGVVANRSKEGVSSSRQAYYRYYYGRGHDGDAPQAQVGPGRGAAGSTLAGLASKGSGQERGDGSRQPLLGRWQDWVETRTRATGAETKIEGKAADAAGREEDDSPEEDG